MADFGVGFADVGELEVAGRVDGLDGDEGVTGGSADLWVAGVSALDETDDGGSTVRLPPPVGALREVTGEGGLATAPWPGIGTACGGVLACALQAASSRAPASTAAACFDRRVMYISPRRSAAPAGRND